MRDRRIRWLFLALLFGSTLLNYIDRQTLSVLKPTLALEFEFSNKQYSWLVTVFLVPYIAMYLLSGPLVDRYGSRRSMAWFVGVWSLATLAAGFARSAWQLGATRFLLGIAEPGNMPAAARVTAIWFSAKERGLAVSIFSAGSALGSIIALPLTAFLAHAYGWRMSFIVLGGFGIVWVAFWLLLYHEPQAATTPKPSSVPWLELLKSRPLMAVLAARMISDPVWYFMLFWIPTFFQEKKGMSLTEIGYVGWIPFLVADLGGIACGFWADRLVRDGIAPAASRIKILGRVAWIGLAGGLLALGLDIGPAMLVFSILGIACMTWFFLTAALIADIFPAERVASALGIVGAAGALGAALFNLLVGRIVDAAGFPVIFCGMSLLHPIAGLVLARGTRAIIAART